MANAHKDALQLLMPVKLGAEHAKDMAIEGQHLDAARTSIVDVLSNMFIDAAYALLPDWERVLGISPPVGATTAQRRTACLAKIRARGGLSRAYFIQLAADLGYAIEIYEEASWHWRVHVLTAPDYLYYFRAGESGAGDRLLDFGTPELEEAITDLKPAHTYVYFSYSTAIADESDDFILDESGDTIEAEG